MSAVAPPSILRERVADAYGRVFWSHFTVPITTALLAWFLWDEAERTRLLGCVAALNLLAVFGVVQGLAFRRAVARGDVDAETWRWIFFGGSVLYGLVWGGTAALLFVPGHVTAQMVLLLYLGGMAAGALTTHLPLLPSLHAFHALSLAPIAVRLAADGTKTSLTLAGMIVVFAGVLTFIARAGGQALLRSMELRLDNAALADTLRAETERLTATLSSIGDGIIATDRAGNVTLVNRVAETLTGRSADDVVGQPLETMYRLLDEASDEAIASPSISENVTGEPEPQSRVGLLRRPDGTTVVVVEHATLIRDTENSPAGLVIALHDDSKRRAVERERYEIIASKLSSTGTLAGGIAHDFNNLLAAMVLNLAMLETSLDDPKEAAEILAETRDAMTQAQGLTRQLLTFAKGGAPVTRSASIGELLETSASFALRGLRSRCQVVLEPELWSAHIDPGQVAQVIQNLLLNADQSMPQGGTVEIRAANVVIGADSEVPLAPGRYVKITVQDHGVGIAPEDQANVFDPYFTTKAAGSGLGLSTAYSIVDKHGGRLVLESELGVGTRVHVFLPAAPAEATEVATQIDDVASTATAARILIMDDQHAVARAAERILRYNGHNVVTTHDGEAAVLAYREAAASGAPYDLVILDLTVPGGMGGVRALEELRKLDTSVRAIAASGYSNDDVMADPKAYGFDRSLAKPFAPESLLAAVAHTLRG